MLQIIKLFRVKFRWPWLFSVSCSLSNVFAFNLSMLIVILQLWAYFCLYANCDLHVSSISPKILSEVYSLCPQIYHKIYYAQKPRGEASKDSIYTQYKMKSGVTNIYDCVKECCTDSSCNVAVMMNSSTFNCYKVKCSVDDMCLPSPIAFNDSQRSKYFMIMVKTSNNTEWQSFIDSVSGPMNKTSIDYHETVHKCEVGLDAEECFINEECVPIVKGRSRQGICKCKKEFSRNSEGNCLDRVGIDLIVSVKSKTVLLPVNHTILTAVVKLPASAVSVSPVEQNYNYEWTLLSEQNAAAGNMNGANTDKLILTDLKEGIYRFQLIVRNVETKAFGQAFANVTVLPPSRNNVGPVAIIENSNQTVILQYNSSTTTAVLDGSKSSDDTKIVSYNWKLLTVPLDYKISSLPSGDTLTLTQLVAGDYTLSLTVTDEDGVSNSTIAMVTVVPEVDYPPTANAGNDIIIFLPNNQVTLNGNQSSDDHAITNWEWIYSPALNSDLTQDARGMRTAQPHISNMEEGVYTYVLKVRDAKGQKSEDQIKVYVKAAVRSPPISNAGHDVEINLPLNWITLNASGSTVDPKYLNLTEFLWQQESGPNIAHIEDPKSKRFTNVTGLTKGHYVFILTLSDDVGSKDSSRINLDVKQDTNAAPVANAGKNREVVLPLSVLAFNGSASSDDLGIAAWKWTRDPSSLAAGHIVGNSSHECVLLLNNVVPGVYKFSLMVWDIQGKSSTDSVNVTVSADPNILNVVEAVLNIRIDVLTENQLETLLQGIALLLVEAQGKPTVYTYALIPQRDSYLVVLQFYVKWAETNVYVKGLSVVKRLKTKLRSDKDLLGVRVLSLETLVCQNSCSGHGKCIQETRNCLCDSFWMQNSVRRYLMDGKSNCEWSIVYVGIFLTFILSAIFCCFFYFVFRKQKNQKPPKMKSKKRYTRLGTERENIRMRSAHTSSLMRSETDTSCVDDDDEVLFQNIQKQYSSPSLLSNNNGGINQLPKLRRLTNAIKS